ncbi:alpha-L-arabinofuranosidase [Mucilaginibacter kameinonensis]|uniref:alpha-L-arabinofuranosidase n=1 Tax=Mucilaginibacter kameinonensis TaxID=452286 RepID=UPI000EF78BA5|nr:alpha-L-arabinofuranosidase [Mucilaginibacter kameinonensis]
MKLIKVFIAVLPFALVMMACKKGSKPAPDPTPVVVDQGNGGATGPITAPTDPSVAATQGFFLDDWQGKTFIKSATVDAAKPTASTSITVTADFSQVVSKVSKYLFGNNINPFTGQYTDAGTVTNITNLSPNIIRAPGGSISDIYFWDLPASAKPADVPDHPLKADGSVDSGTGYWSGNVNDSWSLSLSNYYNLLQKTNTTGIITVNYAYARYGTSDDPVATAAHLAAQWVRYDKGKTKYWEVGNECYGNWEACYRIDVSKNKDGQPAIITGDLYGKHFKVFADSMRKAAADIGTAIKIGAVLHESADNSNPTIVANWNPGVLGQIGDKADFFIVHNYYTNYNENSNALTILNTAPASSKTMMDYVKGAIQTAGVAQKPIALTEWNIFSSGSKQQISNIAGVHAVMVLGEIIKDQYGQASRWDLANGWSTTPVGDDHGLFSYGQPDAPAFTPRPAFYYMYYFQKFFGDRMISSSVSGSSDIVSYASSFNSGEAGVVLVNKSTADQVVNISFKNYYTGSNYYYYTLKGGTDNGEFSTKVLVNDNGPAIAYGGPSNYKAIAASSTATSGGIKVNVPARGVVFLVADKK